MRNTHVKAGAQEYGISPGAVTDKSKANMEFTLKCAKSLAAKK